MSTARDQAVWLVAAIAVAVLLTAATRRVYVDRLGGAVPPPQVAAPAALTSAEAESGEAAGVLVTAAPPHLARAPIAVLPGEPVRVEILNGCGAAHAAGRLTRRARALGLDVVDEGNAGGVGYVQSMVVDRRGNMGRARAVADLLGIPVCVQQVTDHPSVLAEVSIIIGHDHEQLQLLAP
jgi:hypothetical protein